MGCCLAGRAGPLLLLLLAGLLVLPLPAAGTPSYGSTPAQ
jgi:hypothetical protein